VFFLFLVIAIVVAVFAFGVNPPDIQI